MIALLLPHLLSIVHTASTHSGGSGSLVLLLAGPVGGTALYAAIYRYYRNADKSDAFERETRVALKDAITGQDRDQKTSEVRGTRDPRIDGDNSRSFRERVAKLE